ncbi:MAG: Flp pilus assembly protein CpaB [Bryobacteraceae bacterium]
MDRRKKILIFIGAWVSAALLVWFVYANTVAPKAEKQATVVVSARDLPAGTQLNTLNVRTVNYPARDLPKGSLPVAKDVLGRVVLYPVNAGEPLLTTHLSSQNSPEGVSSTIRDGLRAVSVPVTDASGVAGLIMPQSHVDVLFTRAGSMEEASTSTILQNVEVLSTGRSGPSSQPADPRASRSPVVTLLLSPADAEKLELAKNEGKVSLSLRNPLDPSQTASSEPLTADALDPTYADRVAKARRARNTRDVPDAQVWEQLAKKEPKKEEKPGVLVDVYRGDKHVQELVR